MLQSTLFYGLEGDFEIAVSDGVATARVASFAASKGMASLGAASGTTTLKYILCGVGRIEACSNISLRQESIVLFRIV